LIKKRNVPKKKRQEEDDDGEDADEDGKYEVKIK
jgi:hypothetical protein